MRPALILTLALLAAGTAAQASPLQSGPPPGSPHHERRPGDDGGDGGMLFISPVGEPFRTGRNGDPERAWFDGADANHDGKLTRAEFTADAMRWFAVLDRGHDGEIDPDDIDYYENTLVPEIRTGGGGDMDRPHRNSGGRRGGGHRGGGMRGGGAGGGMGGGFGGGGMGGGEGFAGGGGRATQEGGGQQGGGQDSGGQTPQPTEPLQQGAARYALFDYPEPITAMDRNFNRGIDRFEMTAAAADRFNRLDKNGDGVITRSELPHAGARTSGYRPQPTPRDQEPEPDQD